MAESNVREILDADKAYKRWAIEGEGLLADGDGRVVRSEAGRVPFRAGWQACLQALIDAGQIKLRVNE